jgi:murein L,D-transpeptidase YcbB/YkuD
MTQDWHISSRAEDVDSALAGVLRSEMLAKSLALIRPPQEDYAELRRDVQRYRDLVLRGGWPGVPQGKSRKPGEKESAKRLAAVRARLSAEGLLAGGTDSSLGNGAQALDPGVYDRELAGAVAQYQAHHGIVVDSILGSETVASMNVPAEYRLGQLAANLERFRWLPRHLGSDYILVNVPAFRLIAYDSSGPALEMKVIVGSEYEDKNTPVFSDSMHYVVFRPYWNVPDKIAEKEIYPKLAADSSFLARNNYEFFREGGKQHIRQKPGPKNALGLVKFLFPNDFNIYLHDTPDDQLFAKDIRAFSHGCIRLEKPAEMAQWVLG